MALAIVGTIFGSTFLEKIGPSMTTAGVPADVVTGFGQATASGALDFNRLTGVGDLGATILASLPAGVAPAVQPFIDNIVAGIRQAFSLGVAETFWIGVAAAVIAGLAAAVMVEHPLRSGSEAPATTATTGATGRTGATEDGVALRPTGPAID